MFVMHAQFLQRVTGYGSVNATQYPGNCVSGQNETAIASPGGALQLTSSGNIKVSNILIITFINIVVN